MAAYRQTRINEEILHVLSEAMRNSGDPRIKNSIVTVTDVDCAKDLKNATVYYSFFSTKYTEKDLKTALKGASGYFRSCLATKINLRETPLLNFVFDNSIERGNRISAILSEIEEERKQRTETEEKEDK